MTTRLGEGKVLNLSRWKTCQQWSYVFNELTAIRRESFFMYIRVLYFKYYGATMLKFTLALVRYIACKLHFGYNSEDYFCFFVVMWNKWFQTPKDPVDSASCLRITKANIGKLNATSKVTWCYWYKVIQKLKNTMKGMLKPFQSWLSMLKIRSLLFWH